MMQSPCYLSKDDSDKIITEQSYFSTGLELQRGNDSKPYLKEIKFAVSTGQSIVSECPSISDYGNSYTFEAIT